MPSYTEVTKPTVFPNTKWDTPGNRWDEEDLTWDSSGYADSDKPLAVNYEGVPFFDEASHPFLDDRPFERLGEYDAEVPTYTEITKP